jgi:hypothetical protein
MAKTSCALIRAGWLHKKSYFKKGVGRKEWCRHILSSRTLLNGMERVLIKTSRYQTKGGSCAGTSVFDSHFFSFLISLPPQQFFTGTLSPEKERLEQTKVGNKSVLNDVFDLLVV